MEKKKRVRPTLSQVRQLENDVERWKQCYADMKDTADGLVRMLETVEAELRGVYEDLADSQDSVRRLIDENYRLSRRGLFSRLFNSEN